VTVTRASARSRVCYRGEVTARRPRRTSFLSLAALASPVVVTMSVGCRTLDTGTAGCNAVCGLTTTMAGTSGDLLPGTDTDSEGDSSTTEGTTEAPTGTTGPDPTSTTDTTGTSEASTTDETATDTTEGTTAEGTTAESTTAESAGSTGP
jgi:hypothetical protein